MTGIIRVFISSTLRDFKEVRKLLFQKLEKTLEAVAMERFIPVDNPPHDEAIQYLDESDISIFIIGDYYGSVIDECRIRKDECGDCPGNISYTQCEYERVCRAEKPHAVYIVENEISNVLANIEELTPNILDILNRNDTRFSGYTLEEIMELWKMARDKNKKRLNDFKRKISKSELYARKRISRREEYQDVAQSIAEDLSTNIIRWYGERRIQFVDFAGRREELRKLLEMLDKEKFLCVVGIGGIGKTSLIQLALLLENLSGRHIYAIFREHSYKYTKQGYMPAKGKFRWRIFKKWLESADILDIVLEGNEKLEEIKKMDNESQVACLVEALNSKQSILFIDDFQYARKEVRDLIYMCGNRLSGGVIIVGVRENINCQSTIVLSGIGKSDLKEMILFMARKHFTAKFIENNLDAWFEKIAEITQGHPILVDIIVRNADVFPNVKELDGIVTPIHLENSDYQEIVDDIMKRLINEILTEEELKAIKYLSEFETPVRKERWEEYGKKQFWDRIVKKGLLAWEGEDKKLIFTFDAIRELLRMKSNP